MGTPCTRAKADERNIAETKCFRFRELRGVNDNDPLVRAGAAIALGQIGQQPEVVVPALIESLADPVVTVRLSAVEGLARFGPKAREAVPVLMKAFENRESKIASLAGFALMRIDPSAARQAITKLTNAPK